MATTVAFRPKRVNDVSRFATRFRMLLDLQLLTIFRSLKPQLSTFQGTVLDVGGGQAPWKKLMHRDASYAMIDIPSGFDMSHERCAFFDGEQFPIALESCDIVISIEVIEHVRNTGYFFDEIFRVLKPGGRLIATTPWSARLHYEPFDYQRVSPHGLKARLEDSGFVVERISPRGSYFAVVSNKTLIKLLQPPPSFGWSFVSYAISRIPIVAVLTPIFIVTHLLALSSEILGIADNSDPLGWTFSALKPQPNQG